MEGLMFLVLFMIVGSGIVSVVKTSNDNENLEVLKEKAYIKRKVDNVYIDGNGVLNKTFLIVFTVNNEDVECVMKEKDYKSIPENISGMLTHKGTSFMKFEFNDKVIEN